MIVCGGFFYGRGAERGKMGLTDPVNIAGLILNAAAAVCFAWPEQKIPPNEVTWLDIIEAGKKENIKARARKFKIAGFILLGLGLLCQVTVAFKLVT